MPARPLEAVAREHAFLYRVQPLPRRSGACFVDELVVHDAAQPGAWLVDLYEVVDFAEGLYEEFLEQVLGLCLAAG